MSAADKEWEKAMEGQISTVSQLFYGQLRSSICCMTCSSRSITYETFNSLSISLMESYRCTLDVSKRKNFIFIILLITFYYYFHLIIINPKFILSTFIIIISFVI